VGVSAAMPSKRATVVHRAWSPGGAHDVLQPVAEPDAHGARQAEV